MSRPLAQGETDTRRYVEAPSGRPRYVPETRRKSNGPRRRRRAIVVAVAFAKTVPWLVAAALAGPQVGCTTIDPGNNYSLATDTFDSDYFYCHVEPEFIFQQNCGPGDPSAFPSDTGSCHFSAAVNGMNLQAHPASRLRGR